MNKVDIEYNTEKSTIRYPEYGRVIQEMLYYARTITDSVKRQKTVESIVGLMQQLNPSGNRNMDDYREKLWNHAFAIAGYDLDVTPPAGITIRREEDKPKSTKILYPPTTQRLRHYGYNVQTLVKKAIEMPESVKKEGFVEVIASYMKLAYKTWNREHYVSDDVVKDDLVILSDGQLELHEGHSSLDILAFSANKKDKELQRLQQNRNRKNGGKNRNSNSNSNSNNKRNYGNFRKRKK
ncbi:MAG: DUF4290 domain-containing protein [Saprospiraceae bacterium]|nr:DUF4290 domain-containing protein [Saprospiraceae bacterium]